jgi:hypothetical protein
MLAWFMVPNSQLVLFMMGYKNTPIIINNPSSVSVGHDSY